MGNEAHLHRHADAQILRIAVDEIGGQAYRRCVAKFDDRDDIGRRYPCEPGLVIISECDYGRIAADGHIGEVCAKTARTKFTRRMEMLRAA